MSRHGTLHRLGEPVRTHRLALLAALASLALGTAFLGLSSEISEGETRAVDLAVLHAMQGLRAGAPRAVEVMRDLSGLGSSVVLSLFTLATVLYLALFSSRVRALLVAVAVGSGALSVVALKALFGRMRPHAELAAYPVSGLSFPSGHSSMSAVVFLTIGVLVAGTRRRRSEQLFIVAIAALLAMLVGVSRVVLGVHYATDVLGGWAFGAAWAIAWSLALHCAVPRSARA